MSEEEIEAIIATVTPERVRQLAIEVEAEQPEVNRGTAPLFEIMAVLTADLPITAAAERSPLEMRLRQVIIDAVGQIEDMAFVEGDG